MHICEKHGDRAPFGTLFNTIPVHVLVEAILVDDSIALELTYCSGQHDAVSRFPRPSLPDKHDTVSHQLRLM